MSKHRSSLTVMTKYLGPTNTKCARIKATDSRGQTLTVSWDHGLDVSDNHEAAAIALLDFWAPSSDYLRPELISCHSMDGKGHLFVTLPTTLVSE